MLSMFLIFVSVDGQWVDWMQWSGCSVTCGPGTRTRQRLCLDPRPSNGGSDCAGSASETEDCEIIRCEGGFVSIMNYESVVNA